MCILIHLHGMGLTLSNLIQSMRGRHSIMILGWNVNVLQIAFIRGV